MLTNKELTKETLTIIHNHIVNEGPMLLGLAIRRASIDICNLFEAAGIRAYREGEDITRAIIVVKNRDKIQVIINAKKIQGYMVDSRKGSFSKEEGLEEVNPWSTWFIYPDDFTSIIEDSIIDHEFLNNYIEGLV